MEVSWYHGAQFIVIGIAGGVMGGFFGVGAAIVMVPLLIYWAFPALHVASEIMVHLAFGTSLAIVIPTALSSSLTHSKAGNVTWRVVLYLVVTGLAGSYLGAALSANLSGALLKSLFAVLITGVAVQMFLDKAPGGGSSSRPHLVPTLVVGLLTGLFSGFFGVGGGVIAIPLMVRFLGIPIHRSVGISISFVFFASIVGTAGYIVHGWGKPGLPPYSLGYVYTWGWVLAGVPSIFFAKWGAMWARKTKPVHLRRAFALLLAIVGVKMIWGSLSLAPVLGLVEAWRKDSSTNQVLSVDKPPALHVYGPGGPHGPMKECAQRFTEKTGTAVQVTKWTPDQWIDVARRNADLIYGGAEYMLTDFVSQYPGVAGPSRITHLYKRNIGILVRKGNPRAIKSLDELSGPDIRILDVQLEKMQEIQTKRPGLMQNIRLSVVTGEQGADKWRTTPELDAWITYESWHVRLREDSEFINLPENQTLLRATPIAFALKSPNPKAARAFVKFLESEEGHDIFRKWGWL
jgi:accessory colonization factor AcfC